MSGMNAIRGILQDEILQLLATAVIAFSLIGTQVAIDNYLTGILETTGGSGSMMDAANAKLVMLASKTTMTLTNMGDLSNEIGREASKGVFCNFLGVGFTLVNCSPLNAFRGSLTSAAFTSSVALADTYAQQFILSLARTFAFSFLIPLGLFLRVFKVSRQAGGALIAVGFGFYTVFPTVIVATDNLLHGPSPPDPASSLPLPRPGTCEPMEPDVDVSLTQFRDFSGSFTEFSIAQNLASFVLVRVLFMSILNLIITLGFIRTFAHIIGSEIDVSALARIS